MYPQAGIVHRDIKPANIVLVQKSSGECAKVLDFGIAKVKERILESNRANMTLTGTGMVVGTPAYMSPEQAMGKHGQEVDGRSDLYSLGIVAYQMLAGELPFTAESDIGFALAHLQTAPEPIQQKCPDIRGPLADVVMRCLEKNPDRRPASAAQLVEDLTDTSPEPSSRGQLKPPPAGMWTSTTGDASLESMEHVQTAPNVSKSTVPVVHPQRVRLLSLTSCARMGQTRFAYHGGA